MNPEVIDAAARALCLSSPTLRIQYDDMHPHRQQVWRDRAASIIDVALPDLIRDACAAELEAAADAAESMHDPVAPECLEWADWLRARTAAIRAGRA